MTHYTTAQLTERKWTKTMIQRLLALPDRREEGYYPYRYTRYLYSAERVHAIEQQPEFASAIANTALRRKLRLLRATEKRAAADMREQVLIAHADVLLALWSLNRAAKRYRDNRQHGEKDRIYDKKGQALEYLPREGRLTPAGVHRFEGVQGPIYAEILQGGGYTFHRPIPAEQATPEATCLGPSIEAKPVDASELPVDLAHKVMDSYLRNRPTLLVYQWEKPPVICWKCGRSWPSIP